jgi:peptidoglycan hydrolase-like protein with peptidoglycan-binding domain
MTPSYTDWPKRSDKRDQPWADRDNDDPEVVPRAGLPLLAPGGADPAAHALFTALAELGYETSVSRGENPFGVIGPEEMAAVRQFRRDYNVQEDPTLFGGDNDYSRQLADGHIGPWTGEAILRAAEQQGISPQVADDPDVLRRELQELRDRVGALEGSKSSKSSSSSSRSSSSSSKSKSSGSSSKAKAGSSS